MIKRPQNFTFVGVFLGMSTPVLIYIADILGIYIPTTFAWVGVYLLGVIPMIVVDTFAKISGLITADTALFVGVLSSVQIILAYFFAHTAIWYGGAVGDMGAFREYHTSRFKSEFVVVARVYIILFWVYWLFYTITTLV